MARVGPTGHDGQLHALCRPDYVAVDGPPGYATHSVSSLRTRLAVGSAIRGSSPPSSRRGLPGAPGRIAGTPGGSAAAAVTLRLTGSPAPVARGAVRGSDDLYRGGRARLENSGGPTQNATSCADAPT
jgi:hypothetical protein